VKECGRLACGHGASSPGGGLRTGSNAPLEHRGNEYPHRATHCRTRRPSAAVETTALLLTSVSFEYNLSVMQPSGYGLDATFSALADPTRRAILAMLASGEASVSELAEPFEMSQPAISKHLKVLERAGLISGGVVAQRRPRKLEPKPLAEATEWLERYREFWERSFQHLDALLDEMKRETKRRKRR
jgi:DNA-binding transcriptional ArsR family regulator